MKRAAARFTQAEVARIIRGAEQTRVPVAVDFMPDGTIRLHVNNVESVEKPSAAQENPSDEAQGLDL